MPSHTLAVVQHCCQSVSCGKCHSMVLLSLFVQVIGGIDTQMLCLCRNSVCMFIEVCMALILGIGFSGLFIILSAHYYRHYRGWITQARYVSVCQRASEYQSIWFFMVEPGVPSLTSCPGATFSLSQLALDSFYFISCSVLCLPAPQLICVAHDTDWCNHQYSHNYFSSSSRSFRS